MSYKMQGELNTKLEFAAPRGLDSRGELINTTLPELAEQGVDPPRMLAMYRCMLRARLFDSKAIALQRTGQLGTYASCLGQEAIGAAAGLAMLSEDVFVPSYREQTTQLARGVSIAELLLYWGGDERGSCYAWPREDMPCAVPIASQCTHAAGIAYAFKLRKQARVAVVFCGDGATSQGDFYEALNAAGVWQLPMVCIVCNNQWAISVPRSQQTASATLAQKALACGVPAAQLDGNDVIGCYTGLQYALDRARQGGGAYLIEAITYRLGDHTTADDASRYRPAQEVEQAQIAEPIERMATFLVKQHIATRAELDAIASELKAELADGVQDYLTTLPAAPESMLESLYDELPDALFEQWQQLHQAGVSQANSPAEGAADE